ncbi:MAG: aldose 1-epimerase family protein [Planctomycetaceae bacterium]|jgi:hypothetical protein|nr:aldose 1-epimerase family protein [Planctomycetaceae bacterium]
MANSWTLISHPDFNMKQWNYTNTDEKIDGTGGKRHPRYGMRRLHGGLSEGIDVITIDNGLLSMEVLPTRGCGIQRVQCEDVKLEWCPFESPVHPSFVPISDPSGTGWLEGFTEWLVRCGLESNGAPEFDEKGKLIYPLHGRIANIPASYVSLHEEEFGQKEILLKGKMFEQKFFTKNLTLESHLITHFHSTKFTVRDVVTNLSAEPTEFELLYHINTGQPFASTGGYVVVPFDRLAPQNDIAVENLSEWDKLGQEIKGSKEVVFYFEPAVDSNGICKVMLVNAKGDRAIVLSFRRDSLPYFAFWKSRLHRSDGYVCGLEPTINFPNVRSFEKQHGRVAKLEPSESRTFELNFEILLDTETVQKTEAEIRNLTAIKKIEPKPIKEWSPLKLL